MRKGGWVNGSRGRGPFTHGKENLTSLWGLQYSSCLKMGQRSSGPLSSKLTKGSEKIMGPMCCNVMLVKNCSIQNQMLFHLTVFSLKTNALGEMSCTFMICFKSYISCLRFGQTIQRATILAVGASEATECSQIGCGRIWQPETGAAGTAPEWGQLHHSSLLWETIFLHLEEFVFTVCPQISGYQKIYMSFTFVSIFFLQMEQCAQFKAQLIECKEKSQWMANHVEDIKMQLHQTQQGTLWCGIPVNVASHIRWSCFKYSWLYFCFS